MDTQNRQYHLIYGERDWLPLLLEQDTALIWWDRIKKVISLAPVVQQLGELNQQDRLQQSQRRGAAFDHYGNVYWVNENQQGILHQPAANSPQTGEFWHVRELQLAAKTNNSHGDFKPAQAIPELEFPLLSGLTITTTEYLVVGTLATSTHPAGLLIFDLHAGGAPGWMHWPAWVNFHPLDMSCSPDGGLFVLDRHSACVWHLDKNFRVLDCNGDSIDLFTEHDFINHMADSPSNMQAPISIEAISDNAFVILDTQEGESVSTVHYFRNSELVDSVTLDTGVIGNLLNAGSISAHDFAFMPSEQSDERVLRGLLYVSANNIAQAFEFSLQASSTELQLAMQPKLLPMRAQTGKALIVSGAQPYYDFDDSNDVYRWLPLAEQPRHQYQNRAGLDKLIFDSDEPDCVWHRLVIDACIPPGTSVRFRSRAANTLVDLNVQTWQEEPQLYRRKEGSELPHPEAICFSESEHAGSYELLFQNALGRYIELEMELVGTKRTTPLIRACRIYYPRFSYLTRYLPAVYQDDYKSSSFLDRFLANVEGMYTQIESKIAHAESLFDTRTTPPEFLDWLAQWLGAFVDPAWDDARKRLFIDNAALLFHWRGTLAGLRALIKLGIDECPDDSLFDPLRTPTANSDFILGGRDVRIVERFLTRQLAQTNTSNSETSLALTTNAESWQPNLGAGALHSIYQRFLCNKYENTPEALNSAWGLQSTSVFDEFSDIKFPPLTPANAVQRNDWEEFTRDHIGFTYPRVSTRDITLYQEFLQLRYKQISNVNAAHGRIGNFSYTDFDEITLPTQIPQNQTALIDWIEFVSLGLPIHQQAHQFTVFLPTEMGELPADMERRRAQVESIVEREKPAHTQFDVQFFWAMFQVGSARLGIDTSIGEGSRFVAMVLGANFLGQSFLSESHPWNVFNRSVVGRERLTYDLKWRA